MSGRDPVQALMKRARLSTKKAFEPTKHPEKAVIAAEQFHRVAELLETGDVVAAGLAASQAQALFEVLHALWKQDRHEELHDPQCGPKMEAERVWKELVRPDKAMAEKIATHYREHRLTWISTEPPYKAPPPAPKPPRDGARYVSVFVALDADAAKQHGLPDRWEFKHGVTLHYDYAVRTAIERKLKDHPDGWRVHTFTEAECKGAMWAFPRFQMMRSQRVKGKEFNFEHHEVGYRLLHTTHAKFQELVDERDGKKTQPAKRRAVKA
jgi:hypothetical protein